MHGFQRLYSGNEFPFNVPAVAKIEELDLSKSVTVLTGENGSGENGSGKSTILEAIAAAIGFAEQGGELERLGELPAVPRDVLATVLDEPGVPLLAPGSAAPGRETATSSGPRVSSTLLRSSTAATGSPLTFRYIATSLCT